MHENWEIVFENGLISKHADFIKRAKTNNMNEKLVKINIVLLLKTFNLLLLHLNKIEAMVI